MKVEIYDTTLRDGTQAEGISFSLLDKIEIAKELDKLGLDYIEGGWPGSNPKDIEFFRKINKVSLSKAKICAFGSTRRKDKKVEEDPNILKLAEAETQVVTIFGKSWILHVEKALRTSREENLRMIEDSISFFKKRGRQVIFDAEHFFDGYKDDPEYALKTLEVASETGADCLVLCDTNGGCMPYELCSVIPNLKLKLGIDVISDEKLRMLTHLSRFVDELANVSPNTHRPYVGRSAFAHKGGIHVSAMFRDERAYEHIDPALVGNKRKILVSELSGRSNILYKLKERKLGLAEDASITKKILQQIKDLENQGYEFEGADGSFELLVKKTTGEYRKLFEVESFRVTVEKREDERLISEATVKVRIRGKLVHTVAEGNGPVNALDNALRKALDQDYPEIHQMHLSDYKVRILDAKAGTRARTRVLIESSDKKDIWRTVGVSPNIIEASWKALLDSIEYKLLKSV